MDSRFAETDVTFLSGRVVSDLPIKERASVNTDTSFGSEEREVIGLEFRTPSTSMEKAFNFSEVNRESPTTSLK